MDSVKFRRMLYNFLLEIRVIILHRKRVFCGGARAGAGGRGGGERERERETGNEWKRMRALDQN